MSPFSQDYSNTLYINEMVRINTEAKNKIDTIKEDGYAIYDYVFTNLSKNLSKQINKEVKRK